MEQGIEQVYELPGSKGGITVRVTVTEEYDPLLNVSDVSVAVHVKSSSYYNHTYYLSGSVKLGGTKIVSMNSTTPTHYVNVGSLDSYYRIRAQSSSYTGSPWLLQGIAHETDGSKTLTVEVAIKGYTVGGNGGSGWSVADSRTVTLTHIPRASTIGASDAYIGAVSTVSVVRRSSDYTHTLSYTFGNLSGYLDADGNTRQDALQLTQSSIPFALPESFYDQIPDSPSGVCTLTCRTYASDIQVGEPQTATFTVTAKKELCGPLVSGTVTDSNPVTAALTADPSKLVRFCSCAECAISATAQKGASVVSKTVAGQQAQDVLRLENVESGSIVFAATDSRGYSSAVTVEAELIPYIHLTANVAARRTDPTSGNVILEVKGNFYNASFGASDNTLTVLCSANGEEYVLTPVVDGNIYSLQVQLAGLDYQQAHTLTVTVSDCLESVSKSVSVGKGIPVFDWGENDFVFHVPVALPGLQVEGVDLADYIRAIIEGG